MLTPGALLISLVQIAMLFIRCRMGFRNGSFRDSWRFPSGQLTLQFTIKFLREPERATLEEQPGNAV